MAYPSSPVSLLYIASVRTCSTGCSADADVAVDSDDDDDVAAAAAGTDRRGSEGFFSSGCVVVSAVPLLFLDFGVVSDAPNNGGVVAESTGGFLANSDNRKLQ